MPLRVSLATAMSTHLIFVIWLLKSFEMGASSSRNH